MRHKINTRWDPHALQFVTLAATRAGVSINEYVTTAALFRAALDFARDYPESAAAFELAYGEAGAALAEAARQVLETQDPLGPDETS